MSSPQCFDINMQVENAIDDSRTVREKIKGFYVSILVINLKIKVFVPSGAGSISFMPKLIPKLAYGCGQPKICMKFAWTNQYSVAAKNLTVLSFR